MPTAPAVVLRPVREDEFAEYQRVASACFGSFVTEPGLEIDRRVTPLDRTIAAFVDGELVGTTGAYSFVLTVPGGGILPVAGVTSVGVLPTHRRQGLMRDMITSQLDDVARRGEPLAILNASESSIYGRFGYGLASEFQTVELDRSGAAFAVAPHPRPLRMLTRTEAATALPPVYEAVRATRTGTLSRSDAWWGAVLGEHEGWKGGGELFIVLAEGSGDDPGGYVIYTLEHCGPGVSKRLHVRELLAVDDDIEARLWQYCTEVDLVATVVGSTQPADDPLRWRLADPRQLRVVRQQDYLWVRLLDVAAALGARAYAVDDVLVIDLVDDLRPEVGGTFELSVRAGRGVCSRRSGAPHLRLGITELGSLFLGGVSAGVLARAGRITELEDGAAARADRLFRWHHLPHCTTRF